MKKHFGPIVLGLIAMTLAAPAVNATTVLADDNGDVATTGDEQTDKSDVQTALESKLADFQSFIDENTGNLPESQITTLKNTIYPDLSTRVKNAATDEERYKVMSDLDVYMNGEKDIAYTFNDPTGIISATGEKVIVDNYMNTFDKPGTYDITLMGNQGKNLLFIDKDGKTTSSIALTLDESGKFTIDSNYLDKDGNIMLTSNLSADSLKKDITSEEENLKIRFTSSNPDELNVLIDNLSKDLSTIEETIPEEASYAEYSKIQDQMDQAVSKYTTDVLYDNEQYQVLNVPVVKNASVSFQGAEKSGYLKITYDKTGSNLISAEFTDKDGNPVKVAKNVTVKTGLSDKEVTTDNEIGTNEPETPIVTPSTDDHNSSSSTTTDTNTNKKTISNYSTVFYALPNKNVHLYNENGEVITNRGLSGNTDWKADKKMTLNNEVYLRVATNEWVKLTDGLEVNLGSTVVNTLNDAHLYNAKGDLITNRGLAKNTAWRSDKTASINGQTMYRVATNEWVKAADIK